MFHSPDSTEPPLSPYLLILALGLWSPYFWQQGPWKFHGSPFFQGPELGGGGVGFERIQVHYIDGALYFYYYYTVIYNEIIIQLITMQNQWEPRACFPARREAVNTDEASLPHPPLTSCCVARFLTGQGLNPCFNRQYPVTSVQIKVKFQLGPLSCFNSVLLVKVCP